MDPRQTFPSASLDLDRSTFEAFCVEIADDFRSRALARDIGEGADPQLSDLRLNLVNHLIDD